MKIDLHPIIFVLAILFLAGSQHGCDGDFARQQAIAESNARIARACIPAPGEQRILQWAIVEDKQVLYLTIREPLAPRPQRPVQFVVTSEQELQL